MFFQIVLWCGCCNLAHLPTGASPTTVSEEEEQEDQIRFHSYRIMVKVPLIVTYHGMWNLFSSFDPSPEGAMTSSDAALWNHLVLCTHEFKINLYQNDEQSIEKGRKSSWAKLHYVSNMVKAVLSMVTYAQWNRLIEFRSRRHADIGCKSPYQKLPSHSI